MKALGIFLTAAFTGLLLYASTGLPPRGEPEAPLHAPRSAAGTAVAGTEYIRNAKKDAATPNMVTVVLADYRSFDTLGETLVVFTAGIACYLLLRRPEP